MTYQERVYNQAMSDGIPDTLSRLMVAWASHETGYNGIAFNSPVFRSCNNAFGYKWVGQRTAAGACNISPEGDPYARYNSIEDSVHEISLWIFRRQDEGVFPADLRTIATPYQLAVLLKDAGFYGDTVANYSNGLTYWWNVVKSLPLSTKTAGVGLLLLVGLGFVYVYRKELLNKKTRIIFD